MQLLILLMLICLIGSSCSSSRQNLTLSLSSAKDKGPQSCNYANGGLFSKHSGSAQSLASVSKEKILLFFLRLFIYPLLSIVLNVIQL